jgi:signal transduction histidine kinase
MRWPIRYQLLAPLVTLLLGVAAVSTWTAVTSAGRARGQIEAQVRSVARTLGEASFALNDRVLEHMKALSGAEYVLVTPEGRMATFPADDVELPAEAAVTDDWQTLRLGPPVHVAGQTYLCSGVRLRRPGETLYLLYPETEWRVALWQAVWPSLALGLFVVLASLALAVGVGRRLSRRIQELERRTRLIAAGDFSPMPLPGRDDELRDLGRSVNDMAQRLAQLQEAMRKNERLRLLGQVSGGLAHQLRNGVTGARLAVQLHARACGGRADPEALDVALRQLDLVEANLKRFLDLGRADRQVRRPCSLTALVGEAVNLLRPQCRHARIDLRWQPPGEDRTVLGDPSQLGHLFLNVIGNAVEAAGPGGWVDVQVPGEKRPLAVVEVSDSGPGPPADVAPRLFEPFVTGKADGVGLGLAVARQVAEAHGGRIAGPVSASSCPSKRRRAGKMERDT